MNKLSSDIYNITKLNNLTLIASTNKNRPIELVAFLCVCPRWLQQLNLDQCCYYTNFYKACYFLYCFIIVANCSLAVLNWWLPSFWELFLYGCVLFRVRKRKEKERNNLRHKFRKQGVSIMHCPRVGITAVRFLISVKESRLTRIPSIFLSVSTPYHILKWSEKIVKMTTRNKQWYR